MFQIQSFTCEGLRDHLVTDCAAPTFAYFVSSDRAGASVQSSVLTVNGWIMQNPDQCGTRYAGQPLKPFTTYTATLTVASADYIRRHGRPETPEDLRHHQCLTYPRGPQRPQWTFASRQSPDARVTINVQGPFATNNSESLRDAVLAGLGVALLPDFSAREAIGRGLVQELLPAWQPVEVFADRLYVIRPYTPRVSRAVETFSRYLKATFSETRPAPAPAPR